MKNVKKIAITTDSNSGITPDVAKELGVYETVKHNGGWGNVTSRDCGNMVTKAIEMAERSVNRL